MLAGREDPSGKELTFERNLKSLTHGRAEKVFMFRELDSPSGATSAGQRGWQPQDQRNAERLPSCIRPGRFEGNRPGWGIK